jgi:hypothetical protein
VRSWLAGWWSRLTLWQQLGRVTAACVLAFAVLATAGWALLR